MTRFPWVDIFISRDMAADEMERGLENAARYGIGYQIIGPHSKNWTGPQFKATAKLGGCLEAQFSQDFD